jgi:hypothetical protein
MEIYEHGVNIHKLIANGIHEVTVNSHNSRSEFWNVTGWYTRCQIMLDDPRLSEREEGSVKKQTKQPCQTVPQLHPTVTF